MKKHAVALLSGGLDSALAIHLVKRQGIAVTAVHFPSFFSLLNAENPNSPVQCVARQLDVPVVLIPKGQDFLEIIRHPRYGYGKNLNPCIDCRIYTFIKAKELMQEIGATFLVTGEVAGQRPMSQRRHAMSLIDKRADCQGIVLRPLSAKVMPPTVPEQEGLLDRDQLLGVAGRGRKAQLKLANELGLQGYSPPAGGCLLTDKNFSRRVRDLLDHKQEITAAELSLLQVGRHIRIRPGLKVVVGRSEIENNRLEEIKGSRSVFLALEYPGPLVVADGLPTSEEEILIGSIVLRYCKESHRGERIGIRNPGGASMSLRVTDVAQASRSIRVTDVVEESWLAERLL